LIAPYWFATRVISRITDSVNVLALFAVAARLDAFCVSVMSLDPTATGEFELTNHTAFTIMRETARPAPHLGGDRESTFG
jgi:hypothetical protein